jgi:hypothetical protein
MRKKNWFLIIVILLFCGIVSPASANCPDAVLQQCTVYQNCPLIQNQTIIVSDASAEWNSDNGWQKITFAQHPSHGNWEYEGFNIPALMSGAQWIWPYQVVDEAYKSGPFTIRQKFNIPCCAVNISTKMNITADDSYNLSYNGNYIGSNNVWFHPKYYENLVSLPGENIILVNVTNNGGVSSDSNPAGVIYRLTVNYSQHIPCNSPPNNTCCCCCNCSTCPQTTGGGGNTGNPSELPITIWMAIWTVLTAAIVGGVVYYVIKKTK